jgi:hypothetical protein
MSRDNLIYSPMCKIDPLHNKKAKRILQALKNEDSKILDFFNDMMNKCPEKNTKVKKGFFVAKEIKEESKNEIKSSIDEEDESINRYLKSLEPDEDDKLCMMWNCTSRKRRRNLCGKHYKEYKEKTCLLCTKPRHKSGYCKDHFFEYKRCTIDGCNDHLFVAKYDVCRKHYNVLRSAYDAVKHISSDNLSNNPKSIQS